MSALYKDNLFNFKHSSIVRLYLNFPSSTRPILTSTSCFIASGWEKFNYYESLFIIIKTEDVFDSGSVNRATITFMKWKVRKSGVYVSATVNVKFLARVVRLR